MCDQVFSRRSAIIDRSHSPNAEGIVHRMFRNFRMGTIHMNIAVMIPSSEFTDVIAFQFLNRRLASVWGRSTIT